VSVLENLTSTAVHWFGIVGFGRGCASWFNQTINPKETTKAGAAAFAKDGKIYIATDKNGKINESLSDANNLTNSIYHEIDHIENPQTRFPLLHAGTVIKQIQHTTFDKTTASFKASSVDYIEKLLLEALKGGVQVSDINKVIDNYNKYSSKTGIELLFDENTKTFEHILPAVEIKPNKN
jgi:Metallopeptidase toxin 2